MSRELFADIEECAKYELYQLRRDIPENAYIRFMRYEWMKQNGYSIDPRNYEYVYGGDIEANIAELKRIVILEHLYRKFNKNIPSDFPGRSMSVSDVVILQRNGHKTAFYCDSIGFKRIDWSLADCEKAQTEGNVSK